MPHPIVWSSAWVLTFRSSKPRHLGRWLKDASSQAAAPSGNYLQMVMMWIDFSENHQLTTSQPLIDAVEIGS